MLLKLSVTIVIGACGPILLPDYLRSPTPTVPTGFYYLEIPSGRLQHLRPSLDREGESVATIASAYIDTSNGDIHVYDVDTRRITYRHPVGYWDWVSISPDGKRIAVAGEPMSPRLEYGIQIINIANDTRFYVTEGSSPAWSPDGQRIAFSHFDYDRTDYSCRKQIRILDLNTNDESVVYEALDASGCGALFYVAWSPDQTRLAFVMGKPYTGYGKQSIDIFILNLERGFTYQLTSGIGYVRDLSFSPDGSKILFVTNAGPPEPGDSLQVIDMGGNCHRLSPAVSYLRGVNLSADSSVIAFETRDGIIVADTENALGTDYWTAGEPCLNP